MLLEVDINMHVLRRHFYSFYFHPISYLWSFQREANRRYEPNPPSGTNRRSLADNRYIQLIHAHCIEQPVLIMVYTATDTLTENLI